MLSVALNFGLLTALIWTLRESRPAPSPPPPPFTTAKLTPPSSPRPQGATQDRPSLADMRDILREAGVASDQIQNVLLRTLQSERHQARRASSWWKGTPYGGDLQLADPVEMHADHEEVRRVMNESFLSAKIASERDLHYLPEAKRQAVARILQDYAEVHARYAVSGLRIAADQKREELLRQELQHDLIAVLTKEAYLEHTLRDLHSTEWIRLRMDAASLDLTEQEFREAAQEFLTARALANPEERSLAVEQIHADLRTRVGADRIFMVRARNSHDFSQLRSAQLRFGFPQSTTDRVLANWHRAYVAAEALRAETATDEASQGTAWRELAAKTRDDLVDALGTEAAEAYLQQSMNWLRDWESGRDTRNSGSVVGKR